MDAAVELPTVRARSPQPPEPVTPAGTEDGDDKSYRKSLEMVESGPAAGSGSQTDEVPTKAVSAVTPASRRLARIQFATLCWTLFLAGWNDGTTGPLLPRIQRVYHVCCMTPFPLSHVSEPLRLLAPRSVLLSYL